MTRPGGWIRRWLQADGALHVATLAIILGWGCWLRLVHLDLPMRHDEVSTFFQYVSRPLAETLYRYDLQNNHVLHTLLMRGSWRLFGDSPAALRLPALVAGILSMPAAYVVARKLYGREAALLTVGLAAAGSELIKYSTNARGYSLVMLLSLLLVAVADALRRDPTPTRWALFVACTALGVWSVASMLYALAGVLLWLILSVIRNDVATPRWRFAFQLAAATAVAAGLVLLLYSPVLMWGDVGSLARVYGGRVRAWSDFWARHARSIARLWSDWHLGVPTALVPLIPGLTFLGLLDRHRLATARVPAILAIGLTPVAVVLAQRVSVFPRIWSYLLPLYLTLVA
ncbi:MAG TPA: glycosyltransferase family 39 protein, partial [Methylomirabilota bacterium]|nr:glycosyltransferase family 39 protein [Methylomirabilota bacterium]